MFRTVELEVDKTFQSMSDIEKSHWLIFTVAEASHFALYGQAIQESPPN
jgi:hypothetical protein